MIKKEIVVIALMIGLGFIMIPYDDLQLYKNRRNFTISPEPSGKKVKRKKSEKPIFVIQKHNASHLHYDFRLEINGVLKSWAIPKGPSTDPHKKRLAIETENHPLEYATFEGIIPTGHYGAGSVIIWDSGTFENIKEEDNIPISLESSYNNGQIEIRLDGKKLHGGYALIRTDSNDNKKWLCIKIKDEYADARQNIITTKPESIISGKTTEQLENKHTISQPTIKKKQKK